MTTETLELVPRTKRGTPKIARTSDITLLWAERLTRRESELDDGRYDKDSMSMIGDTIRHYGHFPLARIMRDKRGRPKLALVNGDQYNGASGWGSSTSSRQREVRSVIQQHGDGLPSIILPFSALDAAGIDYTSITPLEVRPDRTTRETRNSSERPGPFEKMEDPTGATYEHEEQHYGYRHKETGEARPLHITDPEESGMYEYGPYAHKSQRPVMVDNPTRARVESREANWWARDSAELQSDGTWTWEVERHWLGDALFKAVSVEPRTRKPTDDEQRQWEAHLAHREKVNEARAKWRAADMGGTEAQALHAAYIALADANIHPPDGASTSDGKGVTSIRYEVRRWAKYLSSFDYNEPGALYFLCELPRTDAETVEEAYEALKPAPVAAALESGVDVLRQGDVFAIPTSMTTVELESRAKRFTRMVYDDKSNTRLPVHRIMARRSSGDKESWVLGTTHQGTHVIRTKDGETYARGQLYHAPDGWGREPEHRVVKLGDGKTWYRLVKNTVPVSGQVSARVTTANQSGLNRAWTIGGSVD